MTPLPPVRQPVRGTVHNGPSLCPLLALSSHNRDRPLGQAPLPAFDPKQSIPAEELARR